MNSAGTLKSAWDPADCRAIHPEVKPIFKCVCWDVILDLQKPPFQEHNERLFESARKTLPTLKYYGFGSYNLILVPVMGTAISMLWSQEGTYFFPPYHT